LPREHAKKSLLPGWRDKPFLARQACNRDFCFNTRKRNSLGSAVGFAIAAGKNLLIAALAALVGHGAAGFAGALAGALAFAAAAVGKRLAQAGFGNSFDMFHKKIPPSDKLTD